MNSMSNFEKLVLQKRKAQVKYNQNPSADNLNYMEDLEDEVDNHLSFLINCKGSSFAEVKNYLKIK